MSKVSGVSPGSVAGAPGQGRSAEKRRPFYLKSGYKDAIGFSALMYSRHPIVRLALAAAASPKRSLDAYRFLRRLPTYEIQLSPSAGGERLRQRLPPYGRLLPTVSVAQSVIKIPDTEATFKASRRKQALRTNVTRARRIGIACRVVDSFEEADGLVERPLPGQVFMVAEDAEGRLCCRAIVTVDSIWAYLDFFVKYYGNRSSPPEARYLLHLFLLDELRRRGVQYLWAKSTSAYRKPTSGKLAASSATGDSVPYFQYLVGFDPANLVLRRRS